MTDVNGLALPRRREVEPRRRTRFQPYRAAACPARSPSPPVEILSTDKYGPGVVTRGKVRRVETRETIATLRKLAGEPLATAPDADPCSICMDTKEEESMLSACKHTFCKICIEKWFETTNCCPMCKARTSFVTNTETGEARFYEDYDPDEDRHPDLFEWMDYMRDRFDVLSDDDGSFPLEETQSESESEEAVFTDSEDVDGPIRTLSSVRDLSSSDSDSDDTIEYS